MKKKNKKYIWILGVLLVIVFIIGLIFIKPNTQVSYFNSKNLGLVKTEIKSFNWLTAIIDKITSFTQQAVTFASGTYEVSDTISLTESTSIPYLGPSGQGKNCFISDIQILINPSPLTEISIHLTTPKAVFDTISQTSSFTPTRAETYSAITNYFNGLCDIDGSDCQSMAGYCDVQMPSQSGTNTVKVDAVVVPIECTNVPRWNSWAQTSHDSNALIEKREHTAVGSPPACSESMDNTEYRTTCDTNYVLDNGQTQGSGQLACTLPPQPNSTCTSDSQCTGNQSCHPILNTCKNSDCSTPSITTCSDGSNITIADCTDGFTIPTGLTADDCPTPLNQTITYYRLFNKTCTSIELLASAKTSNDYDTQAACQIAASSNSSCTNCTNQTVYITCWNKKDLVQQTFIGNKTICNSKQYSTPTCPQGWYSTENTCEDANPPTNWVLWGSIIGIIILIIIIVIVVIIKFKK